MNIRELMKEYNLEIDDIRWYLSIVEAEKIEILTKNKEEIVRYIWSGELADNLYNMEEIYINSLQDHLERNITDESNIRDFFAEAELASKKRKTNNPV
ncbi:MAG: hypothetical protein PF518_01405 [Spirochaetaceae bacterium]|jgi:hypothetical protein|nr:hypothetical protein [Spirochaetaceae bacterium]